MIETTLGIPNKTWASIELASAGLLAAITARTTYKSVKQAGGLANYVKPKRDSWKSAAVYSNLLITLLLVKGAIDVAKEYDIISGVGAAPNSMQERGLGTINYF